LWSWNKKELRETKLREWGESSIAVVCQELAQREALHMGNIVKMESQLVWCKLGFTYAAFFSSIPELPNKICDLLFFSGQSL
jgi:hypothetical protein